MQNENQTALNPIEDQRAAALKHYQEASAAIHHWSGFVEAAIKAYNPTPAPKGDSIEQQAEAIITGFSNPTSEGIVLHLNKKTSLKSSNIVNNEFWVSWDKIGAALFDGYTELEEVSERNELRK
jgi:hypothetical protein